MVRQKGHGRVLARQAWSRTVGSPFQEETRYIGLLASIMCIFLFTAGLLSE